MILFVCIYNRNYETRFGNYNKKNKTEEILYLFECLSKKNNNTLHHHHNHQNNSLRIQIIMDKPREKNRDKRFDVFYWGTTPQGRGKKWNVKQQQKGELFKKKYKKTILIRINHN